MATAPSSTQHLLTSAARRRAASAFLAAPNAHTITPPRRRTLPRLAAALILATLAACGPGIVLQPIATPSDRVVSEPLRQTPVRVTRATTLDARQDELLQQIDALGWTASAWDAPTLGALSPFARIVVAQDPRLTRGEQPGERWFVIAEGEWTEPHADALISRLFRVPATPGVLIHFDTDRELPFALDYRFTNEWYGALEAQLYVALAQPAETPGPGAFIDRSTRALTAIGLTLDDPRVEVVDELDRLLRALPRPDARSTRAADVPQATLLAIGLLLGEQVIAQIRGTDWLAGETAEAKFYGVAVSGLPNTVVRPIDFVELAWRSDVEQPLRAYLELVAARIAHARTEE